MVRRARRDTVLPEHPHHVILRGNNRRNLFSYVSCYRLFLQFVARASTKLALPVHAFVLMRNHVHFVVTPRDAEHLAGWVKSFAQRYASRRNRARESTGKLFEQRYTAIPIRSEAQLAATLPYIELNPVRARLIATPDQWRWSSYRLHVGAEDVLSVVTDVWTPHTWWLGLGADAAARGDVYREWTSARDEAARRAQSEPSPTRYRHQTERPDRTRAADVVTLVYGEMRT